MKLKEENYKRYNERLVFLNWKDKQNRQSSARFTNNKDKKLKLKKNKGWKRGHYSLYKRNTKGHKKLLWKITC